MESTTILMPPSTSLSGILLSIRTYIPEGSEYEKKYKHYIDALEKFYQLHTETTTAVATSK